MDINQPLSPHFTLSEFLHNKNPEGVTPTILDNLRALALKLEVIRDALGGKPIKINSGFRTPEHNAEVGGVGNSQHLRGCAADIEVVGMTPHEVQAALKYWAGGLGSYSTWTHVDIFETTPPRRWEGP